MIILVVSRLIPPSHNRITDFCHTGHLADVVNADHVGAVGDAEGDGGSSAFFAVGWVIGAKDSAQELLAGGTDDEGQAQGFEFGQAAEEFEVVGSGLAEAESGVEPELVTADALRLGISDLALKERKDLGDDIGINGVQGQVTGATRQVHQEERDPAGGDEGGHGGVIGQAADVIDERGTGIEGSAGDFGFVGVHGEGNGGHLGGEAGDDGKDTSQLLGGRQGGLIAEGSRAGALTSDVQEMRTVRDEGMGVGDGILDALVQTAVGERVRGDVQDAHHEGLFAAKRLPVSIHGLVVQAHAAPGDRGGPVADPVGELVRQNVAQAGHAVFAQEEAAFLDGFGEVAAQLQEEQAVFRGQQEDMAGLAVVQLLDGLLGVLVGVAFGVGHVQSAPIGADGGPQVALLLEQEAAPEVVVGVQGVQPEHLAGHLKGLIELAKLQIGDAEDIAGEQAAGNELDQGAGLLHGLIIAAGIGRG